MHFEAFAQRHALALIALSLAIAPALAALLCALGSRAACSARSARGKPRSRVTIACATLAPVALGVALFVAIARRVGESDGDGAHFAAADQRLLEAIRDGMPGQAATWFARFTHLGDPWFLTLLCALVCAALVFARRFGLAVYLAAVTGAGGFFNHALKVWLRRDRPSDALVPVPESFSFPSGHTFGAIVCYGMCAYVLMRVSPGRRDTAIVAAASFLVCAIGVSRVVIGVHFPADVIGGFAAGGAWLAAGIGAAEMWRVRTRA
jgi:membrane-associated phospholipid phosphatase